MIGVPSHLIPPQDLPAATAPASLASQQLYRILDDGQLQLLQATSGDSAQITAQQPSGTKRNYRLRRVSDAGVTERNTHVNARVTISAAGQLGPPDLPEPFDIVCTRLDDKTVECGFCWQRQTHQQSPARFDILVASHPSLLASASPICSVTAHADAGETVARFDTEPTDCVLAIRSCADGQTGAISRPIALPRLTSPAAPRLLPSTNP
jgi:hypothetical protein